MKGIAIASWKTSNSLSNSIQIFLALLLLQFLTTKAQSSSENTLVIQLDDVCMPPLDKRMSFSQQLEKDDPCNMLLRRNGMQYLSLLFLGKNYTDFNFVYELLDRMYIKDETLYQQTIMDFLMLAKIQDRLSETSKHLLKLIEYKGTPEQVLQVHIINMLIAKLYGNFGKVKDIYNEYNDYELTLKQKLNETNMKKYRSMLIENSPKSFYNIENAEKVCIKNVGINEYLNTGGGKDSFYVFNGDRRNVYTSKMCGVDGLGVWQIEKEYGNAYSIKSVKYKDYMYAALEESRQNRRVIWMWVPGTKDVTTRWRFEHVGDYVYINSDKNNEYLYASQDNFTAPKWHNGHVYSLKSGSKNCPDKRCLWIVEDCSYL